ncbi:MAG: polysaccharide biosynthesis/export family protein [Sphingomicrobium sp.]
MFRDLIPGSGKLALVICAALGCLVAACTEGPGGPLPYNVALRAPDAPTIVPLEEGYRIAPLDKLNVKVLKMDDLSGDYNVDLAGNISMPLIGEVKAVNLTTAQLDERLTEKLGEKYLENPDVSVGIKESTSRVVTVDGAVKAAGAFPAIGPTSLMRAVALAGGVTEDANPHRVAVFRTVSGQRQGAAFDLMAIRRGQAQDPQIYPGDIIVVDGSAIKEGFKRVLQSFPLFAIFGPL